jgi:hypothetical protein
MPNWDFYITSSDKKGLKAGAFNPLKRKIGCDTR